MFMIPGSDISETFLLHIPHSSTVIPDTAGFVSQKLVRQEINLLTDWATDKIFHVDGVDEIKANWSRVFCDVERLDDEHEPMFKKGMGICYTHCDDGQLLRRVSPDLKQQILSGYYWQHHERLKNLVSAKLEKYDYVYIIDCHSFSNIPFKRDTDQSTPRPDVCLGFYPFHAPSQMVAEFRRFYENHGFSVEFNAPYEESMIPLSFYKKDARVRSIMVEINRKLYMNEKTYVVDEKKVAELQKLFEELLLG